MSEVSLDDLARDFAGELTDIIQGTVGGATEFGVVRAAGGTMIGPLPWRSDRDGFAPIPLRRRCDPEDSDERLQLVVEYRCTLDPEGEYLTVESSTFGLWIRPDPRRGPRPVVRVEYLRSPLNKDHPPAHVHLHAESAELGWIYGTAGESMPRFEEIHFPVGRRRFRPTIEGFLLFLHRERLFRDWANERWREVLTEHLDVWERASGPGNRSPPP